MNIKKIIIIILITVVLLTAALLMVINVNFFKEISPVSQEPKGKPAAEERPKLNYAIPSTAQISETAITGIIEKRKALQEKELEAERARSVRRAEAFARQKALEASLLSAESENSKKTVTPPPPPQKETEPASAEEMKAMEKKGIISY